MKRISPLTNHRRLITSIAIGVVVLSVISNQAVSMAIPRMASKEISSRLPLKLATTNPQKPKVSVHGFPLIASLASGQFDSVNVSIQGICTPGPRIANLDVTLRQVDYSMTKALHGKMSLAPIGSVDGTVLLQFDDVNAYLQRFQSHPTLQNENNKLKISLDVNRTGKPPARVSLDASIKATGRGIQIAPTQLGVAGYGTFDLDTTHLTYPVDLDTELPANLMITSTSMSSAGIQVQFSGSHISLDQYIHSSPSTTSWSCPQQQPTPTV
jgi:hypothetical protein